MITNAGRGNLHRYYTIQDGNHVDGRADLYPDQLRPILPCYREAFLRLTLGDPEAPPGVPNRGRASATWPTPVRSWPRPRPAGARAGNAR